MNNSEDNTNDVTPIFTDHEDDINYKEKPTPKQRFFRICEKLGELFFLNIVFVISCIPIITIGAAVVAMYVESFRIVNNTETYVVKEYFIAFKKNFRQSTILWIFQIIAIALIYLQLIFYADPLRNADSPLKYIIPFEILIFTICVPLQFPLVARYENTIMNYIINSAVYAFMNIFTLLSIISPIFIVAALYYINNWIFNNTWYLWLLILTSLLFVYYSYILKRLYSKIEATQKDTTNEKEIN